MATIADVIITFKTRGADDTQRSLNKTSRALKDATVEMQRMMRQLKMLGLVALGTFAAIFANTGYVSAGFELIKVQIERVFLAITGTGFLQVMTEMANDIGNVADKLFVLAQMYPVIGVITGKVLAFAIALMTWTAIGHVVSFVLGFHIKLMKALIRESSTLTRIYRKMRAEMIRMKIAVTRLVRAITPKVAAAIGTIIVAGVLIGTKTGMKIIIKFIKDIYNRFKDLINVAVPLVGAIMLIKDTFDALKEAMQKVRDAFRRAVNYIKGKFNALKEFISNVASTIREKLSNAAEFVKEKFNSVKEFMVEVFNKIMNKADELKNYIVDKFKALKDEIKNIIDNMPTFKIPGLDDVISKLNKIISLKSRISGIGSGVRRRLSRWRRSITERITGGARWVTRGSSTGIETARHREARRRYWESGGYRSPSGFQRGGIVPGTGIAMVHAGEKIIPANEASRMGDVNITINVNGTSNPLETAREIAYELSREIGTFSMMRRR